MRDKSQHGGIQTYTKRISPQIRKRFTNEKIKHGLGIVKLNFGHTNKELRSNMYILLTKREVKMAGYWPRSIPNRIRLVNKRFIIWHKEH